MALKSTIYKANLQISDMDRHYYQSHALTLACHPSETEERLMARVLVFARHAGEFLEFGKGISAEDEPDLWAKDLTGNIDLWIDLGQPEEKRIRRACGRAKDVFVYSYSGNSAAIWWEKQRGELARFKNLHVFNIPKDTVDQLAGLAKRSMELQCNVQDGVAWLSDGERMVEVRCEVWQ